MVFCSSSKDAHRRACAVKQEERFKGLELLTSTYPAALTPLEQKLHAYNISDLVSKCRTGDVSPQEILRVYATKVTQAQQETNCVADVLVQSALNTPPFLNGGPAADSDSCASELVRNRPLLGVPISLKDTIDIVGHDTSIGMSSRTGRPAQSSAPIVKLLQDAGAILMAKSTVPTGLFSIDTDSDLFGRTTNPHNNKYGVSASTGGGAALVACGGVKIEIGSDVGGSIRLPAHACGTWGLKGTSGRFPTLGNHSSMPGLEAVPIITGPLTSSLDDLEEIWKRVVDMKPWKYDHTCVPLPWRNLKIHQEQRKLKWGIIWKDGVIPPSPACQRALDLVADGLQKRGHEVVDFTPPCMSELLEIGYQLLFADGGQTIKNSLLPGDTLNPALSSTINLINLPRFFKKLLASYFNSSDPVYAGLLRAMSPKTIIEERELVVKRDKFRNQWHEKWKHEGLDFVLSVTSPFPAIQHGMAEKASMMTAGYAFVFNLLDYPAGNIPVTNVDRYRDALPPNFKETPTFKEMNNISKTAYSSVYDADDMHGLPVGVQIVGKRFEEEKVIEGMKLIREALQYNGTRFKGADIL